MTRKSDALSVCPYGYSYQWVSDDLLIAGVVTAEAPTASPARLKVRRKAARRKELVRRDELASVVDRLRSLRVDLADTVTTEQRRLIEEYRSAQMFKRDFLDQLRPDLQRALSYLHDYRQFIAQVNANLNVILQTRYPSETTEGSLERAMPAERAIYWATRYMDEKLTSAQFLTAPEKITDPQYYTRFEFYKLVHKYVHIYRNAAAIRQIDIKMAGECYDSIHGNSEAIAVIPHTFIDNAVKYSPGSTDIEVEVHDEGTTILCAVSSLGPEIAPHERSLIFEIFQRGAAARKIAHEGTGFGLYLARFIARAVGTDIEVEQSSNSRRRGYFWTTFSVRLPKETLVG